MPSPVLVALVVYAAPLDHAVGRHSLVDHQAVDTALGTIEVAFARPVALKVEMFSQDVLLHGVDEGEMDEVSAETVM